MLRNGAELPTANMLRMQQRSSIFPTTRKDEIRSTLEQRLGRVHARERHYEDTRSALCRLAGTSTRASAISRLVIATGRSTAANLPLSGEANGRNGLARSTDE